VVYQAEKQVCRAFPDPKGDGTKAGVKRNFQILPPLDFLAEFTQHIPAKGSHLIRYYGFYSNKSRGMRKKAEVDTSAEPSREDAASGAAATRSSQTWAMLIKRVYEVDPLSCPQCGGEMKVVSFIESRQDEVIEKILRHCGLWQAPFVASVVSAGTTRRGRFGPRAGRRLLGQLHRKPGPSRPVPGADLRRHRHVPGQLQNIPDAHRHGDVAWQQWDRAVFWAQLHPASPINGKGCRPPLPACTP